MCLGWMARGRGGGEIGGKRIYKALFPLIEVTGSLQFDDSIQYRSCFNPFSMAAKVTKSFLDLIMLYLYRIDRKHRLTMWRLVSLRRSKPSSISFIYLFGIDVQLFFISIRSVRARWCPFVLCKMHLHKTQIFGLELWASVCLSQSRLLLVWAIFYIFYTSVYVQCAETRSTYIYLWLKFNIRYNHNQRISSLIEIPFAHIHPQ